MKHIDHISRLESRARSLNLTLSALCKKAKVNKSTVHKWKHNQVDPQIGKLSSAFSRLEAALDAEEARLRKIVAPEEHTGVAA